MNDAAPVVSARPQVYIDVTINGQKMVYDVPTAELLYTALGDALKALNADQGPDQKA